MRVNRKRFMLLAVSLVALNAFFWLAQGGFALPRTIIDQYFGNRMIRAEVLVQTPTGPEDYRIDRGVVKTLTPGTVVLREKNGDVVPIQVDPAATVTGPAGRSAGARVLRVGMRVIVFRLANAAATTIQVEGFGP